jgi:hypothetical protein
MEVIGSLLISFFTAPLPSTANMFFKTLGVLILLRVVYDILLLTFWSLIIDVYTRYLVENNCLFFHSRTVHINVIKVFFIHQLIHKNFALKGNVKIYIKTDPTYFSFNHHHQGGYYLNFAKVTVVKTIRIIS